MKLMLVDDHLLFIEGLQYLLKTYDIEVSGVAQDGKEALMKARILKPDLILMDIMMPKYGGMDALRLIKAEMPDIKIVMLTSSEDDENLFEAVKYGASGYLLKSMDATELIDMLKNLENGETSVSPFLAKRLLEEFEPLEADDIIRLQAIEKNQQEEKLTVRQLEILEMVAKGVTYKEVGDALGLAERTVKYHMGRIIERLHLENRAQVIAYASRIGLVEGDDTDRMK